METRADLRGCVRSGDGPTSVTVWTGQGAELVSTVRGINSQGISIKEEYTAEKSDLKVEDMYNYILKLKSFQIYLVNKCSVSRK